MTTGWLLFGTVLPAIVVGLGWLLMLWHERAQRKGTHHESAPGE
jgi:uncharacterized membrane protein